MHAFEQLQAELRKSESKCELRAQLIPETQSYPPQLPVSAKAGEIAELIRSNQVVVVAGDTGSGKTTQLPKICLEADTTGFLELAERAIHTCFRTS